ncbi:hypothetical protein [Reinekea marinisedimentorum]|uniref:Outer membrane protein beta-barrel domain-containing protein n=1 Tax=Reinekea marinisedimentorum TaxID=230495 RepID=A0A4R3HV24_9GAMM|nr:hypothetical protein [Reinekea marinisedimentorum]TCS35895.1 hypothetical protein BCF53_12911 [Reinekea marinisedimentorum]
MKRFIATVVFSAPALTFAHPGAVDANWCHESPTGFHCHKWDDDQTYTPEQVGVTYSNPDEAQTESENQGSGRASSIAPYLSLGVGVHGMIIDTSIDNFYYSGLTTTAKLGLAFDRLAVYGLYDAAWFHEGEGIYDMFSLTGAGASWQFKNRWYIESGLGIGYSKLDLTGEESSSDIELDANGLSWMMGFGKANGHWSYGLTFSQVRVQSDGIDYNSNYLTAKGAYTF